MSPKTSLLYGEDLAWLHARHYSDFVRKAVPKVIRMLRAEGISNGLVCDVGCGAGQLSAALLKAGYRVVGVDVSAAMIALAKKQARGAKFIHGSIHEVNLPSCNAVVAVGEIFNYVRSCSRIMKAFRNLFRSLAPGGILIFDIKEPPAQKIARVSCRSGPDWAVMAEIEEDPDQKKLIRRITSFRKAGQHYRRQIEIHRLGIYPAAEVRRMLQAAGFSVRVFRGYGAHDLGADRRVLAARKPIIST